MTLLIVIPLAIGGLVVDCLSGKTLQSRPETNLVKIDHFCRFRTIAKALFGTVTSLRWRGKDARLTRPPLVRNLGSSRSCVRFVDFI